MRYWTASTSSPRERTKADSLGRPTAAAPPTTAKSMKTRRAAGIETSTSSCANKGANAAANSAIEVAASVPTPRRKREYA